MNYTKGKWAWQKFGDYYHLTAQHGMREIILSSNNTDDSSICYVSMNKDGILHPVNPDHPNAKLISKAPEMYESLKEMYIAFIWKQGNEKAKLKAFRNLESLLKEIES